MTRRCGRAEFVAAALVGEGAARRERAARRQVCQSRHHAGDFRQPARGRGLPRMHGRRGIDAEQAARVGMQRLREYLLDRRASSTLRPAYITITRCAVSATTPRSWVIRMSAVPSSRCSSRISSRICAWMVTSSAVVGSSAISSLGIAGQRHGDHRALAHAARELVRIFARARCAGSGMRTSRSISTALAATPVAGRSSVQRHRLGDLVADGQHRIERGHRLLEDHRDLVAAHVAHRLFVELQQIASVELDSAAGDAARRIGHQPHQGQRGHALAAAGFADDRQRLVAARA